MKVFGTGGISDVITYLEKRRNIHRKLEQSKISNSSMNNKMHSVTSEPSIAHLILNELDNRNLANFIDYFTEEASFSFGSQEAVRGRKNIEFHVKSFLKGMKKINHKINSQSAVDSKLIVEGLATYVTVDNLNVTLPFCDVWTFDPSLEKIIDYRVYCDPTPLMN